MTHLSLPEQRALLGKGTGAGIEPVSLDPDEDEIHRQRDQAQEVLETGGFFPDADLHTLVARLVLGL